MLVKSMLKVAVEISSGNTEDDDNKKNLKRWSKRGDNSISESRYILMIIITKMKIMRKRKEQEKETEKKKEHCQRKKCFFL